MSEVWRLQTKTDLSQINTNGISVAEYCINEGVMAMGWTLRESIYKELTPDEQNDLKNKKFGVWRNPPPILYPASLEYSSDVIFIVLR